MRFTIPKSQRAALAALVSLPAEEMQSLIDAFKAVGPAPYLRDLATKIAERLHSDHERMYDIVSLLASLQRLRQDLGKQTSTRQFVSDVLRAAKRDLKNEVSLTAEEWSDRKVHLRRLLEESVSILVTSKASEIRWESERVLCPTNCRLMTDIRPIFAEKIGDQPAGAMVMHTLKLAYHPSGNHEEVKDFFVVLDGDDLLRLYELIERAIEKEQSLKSLVERTSVPYLGAE